MRLMNFLNYIFVHQDARYGLNVARIKGVNKLIFFEKCGDLCGLFYAFNELGELYFRTSRCTLRTKS